METKKIVEYSYLDLRKLYCIKLKFGYLLWQYGTADNVEIEDMGVKIKRQGYGSRLIKTLIEKLKPNPPSIIYLFTKKENQEARKFYEAIGFMEDGKMGDNILYWQYYETLETLNIKQGNNKLTK